MRKENVNIVGDKPVKNETEDVDWTLWKAFSTFKFEHLSNEPQLEGPPIQITTDMVHKVI